MMASKLSKATRTKDETVEATSGGDTLKMGINETIEATTSEAQYGKRVSFARRHEIRRFTPGVRYGFTEISEHDGDLVYKGFPNITKFEIMRAGWEENPTRKLMPFDTVIEVSQADVEALRGTLMTCSDIARIVAAKLGNADMEDQDPTKANCDVSPDTWFAVSEHDIMNFRRYENISSVIEFWRNELDNIHQGAMPFFEVAASQMMERNRLITEQGSHVVYFKQARNIGTEFMYIAKIEFDEVIRPIAEVETDEVTQRTGKKVDRRGRGVY